MAENWLKYTPTSNTNNGSISYSTDFFYGRKTRSTISTISTKGLSIPTSKNVTVKQYGYGPYCYVNGTNVASLSTNPITVNTEMSGTTATFNFDTNYSKIEIKQIDTSAFPLTLNFPSTNSWTGKISGSGTWTNNNNIVGDPGATQRYTTSLVCTFATNTGASRGGKLQVRGYYNSSEHDVEVKPGVETYREFILIVNQSGIVEYNIVGGIMPLDQDGDNTTWKVSFIQSNPNPTTLIEGNFRAYRVDGDFDICKVYGTISDESNYLQVYTELSEPYKRNPDQLTNEFEGISFFGTSQTPGYVCTGVLVNG